MEHTVKHMKLAGRTMLLINDQPALIALIGRPSTTAHGRMKAAFVIPTTNDDGTQGFCPLGDRAPEMRIELN